MSPPRATFMLSGPSHQELVLFGVSTFSRAKFERTEKLAASVHRVARELNEVSNRLWQTIEPGLAAIDEAAKPSDG